MRVTIVGDKMTIDGKPGEIAEYMGLVGAVALPEPEPSFDRDLIKPYNYVILEDGKKWFIVSITGEFLHLAEPGTGSYVTKTAKKSEVTGASEF